MRASRVVTVGIAVVTIFVCWCNSVHAGPSLWPTSKGEICFNDFPNPKGVRLAVFRTIGNNYIVHGFVIEEHHNPNSLFNGNAIVDGKKISMHVSSSGYIGNINSPTEVYGSIGRVELNAKDLTGWVVAINFHCDPNPSPCDFEGAVSYQFLYPTPCPNNDNNNYNQP